MVKRSRKTVRRGAAAVEAALVFPLLLLLTFGVIEYGWLFLKAQQITNAARQAARIAIRPDATTAYVQAVVDSLMADAGMADSGYTTSFEPMDISSLETGDSLTVQVTVPGENVSIMNAPFLPQPSTLGASVTMAKEGP